MIVAGHADVKDTASPADTDAMLFNVVTSQRFAPKRCYHFFDIASCSMSDLRHSSAYIFFNRAFSTSSSLRRVMSAASIPPYLERQL